MLSNFFVECRAEVTGDVLRGHASVFGRLARIGNYWERIERGAFDKALDGADVRALVNHDPSQLLGRTASGTLRLATDSTGLAFEVDLPDTTVGRDLRQLVERGDLSGASFAAVPGEDQWSRAEDGRQLRTHVSFRALRDVSAVTFPAYTDADVVLRAVELTPLDKRTQIIIARAKARGVTTCR